MSDTKIRHIPSIPAQHRPDRPSNGSSLRTIANIVEVLAGLWMVSAVLVGIELGKQQSISISADLATTTTSHPLLLIGIGVAAAGIFSGMVLLMFGAWARTYAIEALAASS